MNIIVNMYHALRSSRLTFKFTIWLKEAGGNRFVKKIIGFNRYTGSNPQEMEKARVFMKVNSGRINRMLNILADEKSREVWKAVMKCRETGKPIPEKLWSDTDQYFVKDIIQFKEDEVFIDGGAFIGDTIQHMFNYAKKSGVRIKKVIAFEPDPDNRKKLVRNFRKDIRVEVIAKGLSNTEKILFFSPNGSGGTFVNVDDIQDGCSAKKGMIRIPVTSIDRIVECQDATFIKMDIEGAELSALEGGKGTIKKNYPTLAICIYHSLEDMVGIIEFVYQNFPEYKIYVRHHTGGIGETVMYAVTAEKSRNYMVE